ncbi:unnamed protein product [Closterium sp. NIES-54]
MCASLLHSISPSSYSIVAGTATAVPTPSQSGGGSPNGAIAGIAVAESVAALVLLQLLLTWRLCKGCRTKGAAGGDINGIDVAEKEVEERDPEAAAAAAAAAVVVAAGAAAREKQIDVVVDVEAVKPHVCQKFTLEELARATGEETGQRGTELVAAALEMFTRACHCMTPMRYFGLVKLTGGTAMGTSVAATRVMGTPGYVDTAYYKSHKATPAADVYSFGVVILVVISASKAVHVSESSQISLKQWIAPFVESGAMPVFKDPGLDAPDDLVLRLARLALSCTAMHVASRPSMNQVLGELVKLKQEAFGAHVSEAISRIDMEIGSSIGSSGFTAEMARAQSDGMQSDSAASMP